MKGGRCCLQFVPAKDSFHNDEVAAA